MVGLGPLGSESALARVSLVNFHGAILLDTFVAPRERVTDWRTWVSGVREADLVGAPDFATVQKQVSALIEGRILVGHAIDNDLSVGTPLTGLSYGVGALIEGTGTAVEPSWTDGAGYAEMQGVAR